MDHATLERRILESLLADWGYLMGSAGIRRSLGFSNQAALRVAIADGRVPFQVFTIAGRRGPYALTHDVADWLASHGAPPATENFPPKRTSRRTKST